MNSIISTYADGKDGRKDGDIVGVNVGDSEGLIEVDGDKVGYTEGAIVGT